VQLPSPPRAESDLALMALVAKRDARSQRALLDRLSPRVRRVARCLAGSAADGDDAAQLALIEILNSAESFRFESSLEAWADRVTARTTLRLLRRERRRRNVLLRWLVPGTLPWTLKETALPQELHGLEGLLAQLSDARREALVLRHALDFSVEEIAELTASPAGTVKDRLVAARRQLRRLLERDAHRARGGRLL